MKCDFCPCEGCKGGKIKCEYGSDCNKHFKGTVWNFGGGSGCKKCADAYFKQLINNYRAST